MNSNSPTGFPAYGLPIISPPCTIKIYVVKSKSGIVINLIAYLTGNLINNIQQTTVRIKSRKINTLKKCNTDKNILSIPRWNNTVQQYEWFVNIFFYISYFVISNNEGKCCLFFFDRHKHNFFSC